MEIFLFFFYICCRSHAMKQGLRYNCHWPYLFIFSSEEVDSFILFICKKKKNPLNYFWTFKYRFQRWIMTLYISTIKFLVRWLCAFPHWIPEGQIWIIQTHILFNIISMQKSCYKWEQHACRQLLLVYNNQKYGIQTVYIVLYCSLLSS